MELDIEYRDVAARLGVPHYFRAPAQNSDDLFIAALGRLVRCAVEDGPGLCSHQGGRLCPSEYKDCPNRRAVICEPARLPEMVE